MKPADKFIFDPYCDIKALSDSHKTLIMRNDYPDQDRWLEHLEHDLMRFWQQPGAADMSKGLWRSFLTDDAKPLPGLDQLDEWPPDLRQAVKEDPDGTGALLEGPERNADKNFVRSHSRQTFAYGVAYHMTGKVEYFQLCRQGALVLMDLVKDDGSMCSKRNLKTGEWFNDPEGCTSQDLAYGMTGIAFYYYLTHDEMALKKILELKEHIFTDYYHPGKDIITWLPIDFSGGKHRVELVSHLDQLYAYMLWLTPSLPAPHKQEFLGEMERIVNMMLEHFYSEVHGAFWGASDSPDMKALESKHSDFGHSVKTMWVIYQIGVWLKNPFYIDFSRRRIHGILEAAFDPLTGSWNRRRLADGSIERDKEWWSLAELDQAAAILALKDPAYLQYLNRSYSFWFDKMVDHEHGEIWHSLDGVKLMPQRAFAKAHCWKNALHSFEHALVGYLTSRQLLDLPIPLYYAFKSKGEVRHQTVSPYLFKGNISAIEVERDTSGRTQRIEDGGRGRLNIKVTFDSLH